MKTNGIAALYKSTKDETWGYCESETLAQESDKELVQNEDNQTVGTLHSNFRTKVSGTFTPKAGVTNSPADSDDLVGEVLEVNPKGAAAAIKIIIDDAELKFERGKCCGFSFNGYYYPDVVISAGA